MLASQLYVFDHEAHSNQMSKLKSYVVVSSASFILWRFLFVIFCPNLKMMQETQGIRTIKTFTEHNKCYLLLINLPLPQKTQKAVLNVEIIVTKKIHLDKSKVPRIN